MSTPTTPRSGDPASTRRSYTPFIVLAVIVVVAIGIALLASGGDDDDGDVASDGGTTAETGGGGAAPLATAPVTVNGDELPPLPDSGEDPATGTSAPTLEGVSPAGDTTTVGYDEPTLLAFMAHWCPHCQAELPELVELAEDGGLEGIDPVVVLTGTDPAAPNYPPAAWVEEEGWDGPVLLDDQGSPAASAFGLTSYPYLVLVDADGNVIDRNAGGLGLDGLREFVSQAG